MMNFSMFQSVSDLDIWTIHIVLIFFGDCTVSLMFFFKSGYLHFRHLLLRKNIHMYE